MYISHPTENGTLYAGKGGIAGTVKNLWPGEWDFHYSWMGPRLGYGLMARKEFLGLTDIAELTDVSTYIGGTEEVGALFGEEQS